MMLYVHIYRTMLNRVVYIFELPSCHDPLNYDSCFGNWVIIGISLNTASIFENICTCMAGFSSLASPYLGSFF
jgi:hypothetical protein